MKELSKNVRPYFYIIQHVSSGKYYVGSKYSKNANPNNLMIEGGYTTSSKIVNDTILKEGVNSFIVNRVKTFNNKELAYEYETRFLKKVNAAFNEKFINRHNNDWCSNFDTKTYLSFASEGGKIQGKINVENGHMDRIRQLVDVERRQEKIVKLMRENRTGFFSLSKEDRQLIGKKRGKIQGKINAENGHMNRISKMVDEEKRINNLKKSLIENKTGCFLNPDLHRRSAILGGKAQGKRNAEMGHLKRIAKQYWDDVKNGNRYRAKRAWYNDGNIEKQLDINKPIPSSFTKGRLKNER